MARSNLQSLALSTPIYDGRTRTLTNFTLPEHPLADPADHRVKALTLDFLTPLRLKEKGDLVTRLTFPLFFARLTQRLILLAAFYGKTAALLILTLNEIRARDGSEILHVRELEKKAA